MAGISIAIYVLISLTVVGGILLGLRRGLYKSLIDLGVTIVSIIISVFVAKLISKSLVDETKLIEYLDLLMENSADMVETLTPIKETLIGLANDTNALGMIMAFPVILLTPIVFIIVYSLVSLILKIPKVIVARCVFGKNGGETYRGGSRPFGAVVGVVAKILSFMVTLVPLVGYIMLVNNTMISIGEASIKEISNNTSNVETMSFENDDDLQNETPESQSNGDSIKSMGESCLQSREQYLEPLASNPIFKAIYVCGGEWFFDSLTSTKVEGEKVQLSTEIDVLSDVYADVVTLIKVPTTEYGEAQTTAVDNIAETLGEAKIIPSVISGTLSYSSKAWLEGKTVFGASKVVVGDYYEPTLNKLLVMYSQTTNDTIKEDLQTMGDIVNVLIEQGAFVEISNGTPINIPKNEEFMGQLFVELYENDRTRPLAGDLINSFENYLYKIYNDVNGTNVPYPVQLDINSLTKESVYEEGKRMANILNDFSAFYETVDMNETDNTKFLIKTDVRSLGKALDEMEQSVLFGDSYTFLLSAILKSEGAAQFAFMTPEFADAMINRKSSMETVLVSRQQIAIILSATKGESREDAIKYIIANIDSDSAEVIKETLTKDVLTQFGMNNEQSESMSNTLNSVVDQIAKNEDELSEEQLNSEMMAIDMIVNTVKGATSGEDENLFSQEEGDYSKSDFTADQFVKTVVESNIVTSAIIDSSKDEDGNAVEDPYKISSGMSESDKENVTNAIENYYQNNQTQNEDNEELKGKLDAIANVLGIQVSLG